MILIGLGANLPSPVYGPPRATLEAALSEIAARGIGVVARSPWYASTPVPASDQPDYVNAVARLETDLEPGELMHLLHAVEASLGRTRSVPNAARIADIDLLDWHGRIQADWPILPHPRMAARAFVLRPLADVAPDWTHPVSGRSVDALLAAAPDGAGVRPHDAE
jgi:2-amino-4-hydroxy-6-hydroxymethyldihydropteridine diphosphokinase